jgi:hypothetical protein
MNIPAVLHYFFITYKSYSSVILAVVSGLGMILSKKYAAGFSDVCQAIMVVFWGASVAELRHAVANRSSKSPPTT